MQATSIIVNMKNALEIILHDSIQQIFDHFAASFDIVVVFYSLDGRIVCRSRSPAVSDYCRLVQNRLYGSAHCTLSDETRCRECTASRRIVNYRCHAGIEEAVAPIFIANQLAGYAMIGQFRSTASPDSKVLCDARKRGCAADLKTAFDRLVYYNEFRKQHLLGLFATLVDYIITKEIVTVSGERLLSRVMAFIEQNLHRPIRLPEAAKTVNRSCSSISHAFRVHLNKSFSQAVIEAKLQRAEEYFRQSPELSIGEVAERLGYADPLYFSRLYRKIRGFPPSQYHYDSDPKCEGILPMSKTGKTRNV